MEAKHLSAEAPHQQDVAYSDKSPYSFQEPDESVNVGDPQGQKISDQDHSRFHGQKSGEVHSR